MGLSIRPRQWAEFRGCPRGFTFSTPGGVLQFSFYFFNLFLRFVFLIVISGEFYSMNIFLLNRNTFSCSP